MLCFHFKSFARFGFTKKNIKNSQNVDAKKTIHHLNHLKIQLVLSKNKQKRLWSSGLFHISFWLAGLQKSPPPASSASSKKRLKPPARTAPSPSFVTLSTSRRMTSAAEGKGTAGPKSPILGTSQRFGFRFFSLFGFQKVIKIIDYR